MMQAQPAPRPHSPNARGDSCEPFSSGARCEPALARHARAAAHEWDCSALRLAQAREGREESSRTMSPGPRRARRGPLVFGNPPRDGPRPRNSVDGVPARRGTWTPESATAPPVAATNAIHARWKLYGGLASEAGRRVRRQTEQLVINRRRRARAARCARVRVLFARQPDGRAPRRSRISDGFAWHGFVWSFAAAALGGNARTQSRVSTTRNHTPRAGRDRR